MLGVLYGKRLGSKIPQAIFESNRFPYKYPNISQTYSFFIRTCLRRWNGAFRNVGI